MLKALGDAAPKLSAAERRVAVAIADDPRSVAFGTMAELVERSLAGAGTIARLCAKLGFDGYSALQRAVQDELVEQLRPAALRIRESVGGEDLLGRVQNAEVRNLSATLDAVSRTDFAAAVKLLADPKRHVVVLASHACFGVGLQFANELSLLRPNVELLDGNAVAVGRRVALADGTDTVVAMDFRRYDSWLVDTASRFVAGGASLIALTDSALSPIAERSALSFVIHAEAPGPFDSLVATLALVGALSAGVAERLKTTAALRLAKVEQAWTHTNALQP